MTLNVLITANHPFVFHKSFKHYIELRKKTNQILTGVCLFRQEMSRNRYCICNSTLR